MNGPRPDPNPDDPPLLRWRVTTKPVGYRKSDDAVGETYTVQATRAEIVTGGHVCFWIGDVLRHVRALGTFEAVDLEP